MKRLIIILTQTILIYSFAYADNQPIAEVPPSLPYPTNFWQASYFLQLEEGYWAGNFFGHFRVEDPGNWDSKWIYHQHHGWVWIETSQIDNIWMRLDGLGWCFTLIETYPMLFSEEKGWIYYLKGTANPQWFYSYSRGNWFFNYTEYPVTDIELKRIKIPEEVTIVTPIYPDDLIPTTEDDEDRIMVSVHFVVNKEGFVENAAIPDLSYPWIKDRPDIEDAVLTAINQSFFKPPVLRGKIVKTYHHHQYYFKLRGNISPL